MKKSWLLIAAFAVSTPAVCATLESLNKEQLIQAFVNKTAVSVTYDVFHGQPMPTTTFSYYLDDKGNIFGKFSKKPQNEPQTDTGVYYIEQDGSGYFTWKHWYDGKKICFHIFNTQNAYISVDCNNVFHTVYLKNAIKSGKQL